MKLKPNILKLVDAYQYKSAICYSRTNERIYCNLKKCYIIGFIYQTVIMFLLSYGEIKLNYLERTNIFTAAIISFAFFVCAFVLMLFKWDCISLPLNIAATVFLWPLMKEILFMSGVFFVKGTFYFKHLIPLVLIIIPSIWMCIISTRERYLIRRDYKVVMEKLYNKHRTAEMSDDEWEDFINNYNDSPEQEKTIK